VSEGPAEVDGELPLRAENARLLRLLKLTRAQAAPPRPVQTGFFEAPPGPVHAGSPPEAKVALFGALFAARSDVPFWLTQMRVTKGAGGSTQARSGHRLVPTALFRTLRTPMRSRLSDRTSTVRT
jgi:hypothetical protein